MVRAFCFLFAVLCVTAVPTDDIVASRRLNTAEEINSHGYMSETHQVTTEDGYILTMHRIPSGRNETTSSENKPVVFIMHGLYGSSQNFVFMGPEHSIGYHLVDSGFDVWMGNYRGNVNSRSHVTMDPDAREDHMEFFNFSFDDIGLFDIPAMIDYILAYTGRQKLHYIGHSQGGTVFLVLCSMRPEYNEKMASVHLLAGVGYQDYFPNTILRNIAQLTNTIYSLALSLNFIELSPYTFDRLPFPLPIGYSRSDFCFGDPKYKPMCELIGAREFLREDDPVSIISTGFGGGSLKQIAHYGQNIRDKVFRRYHYGMIRNFVVYGSADPPEYDLSLITANVTMHYTVSDELLDERDVIEMAANMPNTVARRVARDSFLHLDFIAATDARELVTDYVIDAILVVHASEDSSSDSSDDANSGENISPIPESTDAAVSVSINKILSILVCVVSLLRI